MLLDSANPYSEFYARAGAADKYHVKFQNRTDAIRHAVEAEYMRQYATGKLFDCSIGCGRFVDELEKVHEYSGMDYSLDFLKFVNEHFPRVRTFHGDLEQGIDQPNESYDTVICIRTLFALRSAEKIIQDMGRILKPGGHLIIDSGKTRFVDQFGGFIANGYDDKLAGVLRANNMRLIKKFKLDGMAYAIKKCPCLMKLFNSRLNIIPVNFYLLLEKLSTHLFHKRMLIVAQKI